RSAAPAPHGPVRRECREGETDGDSGAQTWRPPPFGPLTPRPDKGDVASGIPAAFFPTFPAGPPRLTSRPPRVRNPWSFAARRRVRPGDRRAARPLLHSLPADLPPPRRSAYNPRS